MFRFASVFSIQQLLSNNLSSCFSNNTAAHNVWKSVKCAESAPRRLYSNSFSLMFSSLSLIPGLLEHKASTWQSFKFGSFENSDNAHRIKPMKGHEYENHLELEYSDVYILILLVAFFSVWLIKWTRMLNFTRILA